MATAHRLMDDLFPPLMVGQTSIHISLVGVLAFGLFLHALFTMALPVLTYPHGFERPGLVPLIYAATAALGAMAAWIAVDPAGVLVPFAHLAHALISQGTSR
jgi:hypothetical protein